MNRTQQTVTAAGVTGADLARTLKHTAEDFDALTRDAIRNQTAIEALGDNLRRVKQLGVQTHQPNGAPRKPEEWQRDLTRAIIDRAKVRGRVMHSTEEIQPGIEALPSGAQYWRDEHGALRRIKANKED